MISIQRTKGRLGNEPNKIMSKGHQANRSTEEIKQKTMTETSMCNTSACMLDHAGNFHKK